MKITQFLKWVYYDFRNPRPKVPEEFIIFVGPKGKGKTASMQYHQSIVRGMYDVPINIFANYKSKFADPQILLTANDIMLTPPNSVIYIDEANEKFDSQDWANFPAVLKKLITQNRHLNKTVVMGAQRFLDINKRFRDKFDYVIEVNNIKHRWIFWKAYQLSHYKAIAKMDEEGKILRDRDGEDIIDKYKGERTAWRQSFIMTNDLYNSYDDKELIFGL